MGSGAPMFVIVDNATFDLTVTVRRPGAAVGVGQPEFSTTRCPGAVPRHRQVHQPTVSESTARSHGRRGANPEACWRGMFVKGEIQTGRRAGVLQMPRAALLSWTRAGRRRGVRRQRQRRERDRCHGQTSGDLVRSSRVSPAGRGLTRGASTCARATA